MSSSLNGSSVLQRFECSNVVEICNRIIFNFYLRLPHIGDDKVSITDFYVNNINPEIDVEQTGTLSKAYLGKSKECLDLIYVSVELNATVNSFGPFIVDTGVPLIYVQHNFLS